MSESNASCLCGQDADGQRIPSPECVAVHQDAESTPTEPTPAPDGDAQRDPNYKPETDGPTDPPAEDAKPEPDPGQDVNPESGPEGGPK